MTTITVKIVSQLTGDLKFNSPQHSLPSRLACRCSSSRCLNIYALYIVRKYGSSTKMTVDADSATP